MAVINRSRMILSTMKPIAGNGNFTVSQVAYFSFAGLVRAPKPIVRLACKLHQGSAGASVSAAEIGLFSTPIGPNGAGQSLTKLVAANLGSVTVAGPAMATASVSYTLLPGTYLWLGIRIVWTGTSPSFSGADLLPQCGEYLQTTSSSAFSTAGPWSGTVPPAGDPQFTTLYALMD